MYQLVKLWMRFGECLAFYVSISQDFDTSENVHNRSAASAGGSLWKTPEAARVVSGKTP